MKKIRKRKLNHRHVTRLGDAPIDIVIHRLNQFLKSCKAGKIRVTEFVESEEVPLNLSHFVPETIRHRIVGGRIALEWRLLGLLFALLFFGCATNGGPGFRLSINPAAQYGVSAPMSAWATTKDNWQIEYVAYFVDLMNRNGVRCPQSLSVSGIRYDLLTRWNQGRVPAGSLVWQEIDKITAEQGCKIMTN